MKSKQAQIVVNVEAVDKAAFNVLKTKFNLSDKELFAVILKSQQEVKEEDFQALVDSVVKAKQIAKVQAKVAKLEEALAKAIEEAVNPPVVVPVVNSSTEDEGTETTPLVVVG